MTEYNISKLHIQKKKKNSNKLYILRLCNFTTKIIKTHFKSHIPVELHFKAFYL